MQDRQSTTKTWLAMILTVLWIAGMVFAFWWFQLRNIQMFDANSMQSRAVFFESGQLGYQLETGLRNTLKQVDMHTDNSALVVHYWDPECPCNKFNQQHVSDLINDYATKGVRFIVIARGANHDPSRLQQARAVFKHPAVIDVQSDKNMQFAPPSSPAAAIMDSKGKLTYFGPYSVGAVCNVVNGAFVENILDGMASDNQSGKQKRQLNTLATGCFCDWKKV